MGQAICMDERKISYKDWLEYVNERGYLEVLQVDEKIIFQWV
jgi:hypothetical protein